MSGPVRITWARTLGRARNCRSTALAVAGFLAACAVRLAIGLREGEGASLGLAQIWAAAVAPVAPVLAAFLGMDVWSAERQSGRIDLLLSAPVREREYTLGKFLGVWTLYAASVVLFLVQSLVALRAFAPQALAGTGLGTFLPALAAIGLQGLLWCAVAVAASAATRSAAVAAGVSAVLLVAIPRVVWHAVVRFFPALGAVFGEMPVDAQAVDLASGMVSSCTVLSYGALSAAALFAASKFVALLRYSGRGGRGVRLSTGVAIALAFVLAAMSVAFFRRFDATLDVPVGRGKVPFSARTLNILREARGEISVTAFLPRADPRFRAVAHVLRSLRREADAQAGVRLAVRYVDPRWDLGDAERLVRAGVRESSVVFASGRRQVVLPVADGVGERAAAGAILQLTMPPQRRNVYWTRGHGEFSFDGYGPAGMSDIARELARDGYRNLPIDLGAGAQVPADCALVVVAGARDDFSRAEAGRLDAYLRQGGRLLVLADGAETGGVLALLPSWGILPAARLAAPERAAFAGGDTVVSEFSDHQVAARFAGSQLVLDRPITFQPSAAADQGVGADRIEFAALAGTGDHVFAALAERGATAGADTAIRPTRIVAIGDGGFATNAHLAERANANRDFFLNCAAYLSGSHAVVSGGPDGDVFVAGMDGARRFRFTAATVVACPLAAMLALLLAAAVGRRRRG